MYESDDNRLPEINMIPLPVPRWLKEPLCELPKPKHRWIRIHGNGQYYIQCPVCTYYESMYKTHIRNFCPYCGERLSEDYEDRDNIITTGLLDMKKKGGAP